MNQLPLFSPARLARSRDPRTSKAAAENVASFRASHEALIFSAIVFYGLVGANYKEIAALTGMEPVAVARRLSGMEERGLITRRLALDEWQERNGMALWWKA